MVIMPPSPAAMCLTGWNENIAKDSKVAAAAPVVLPCEVFKTRARRVAGLLNQPTPTLVGQLAKRFHIRRQASKIDGNDAAKKTAGLGLQQVPCGSKVEGCRPLA